MVIGHKCSRGRGCSDTTFYIENIMYYVGVRTNTYKVMVVSSAGSEYRWWHMLDFFKKIKVVAFRKWNEIEWFSTTWKKCVSSPNLLDYHTALRWVRCLLYQPSPYNFGLPKMMPCHIYMCVSHDHKRANRVWWVTATHHVFWTLISNMRSHLNLKLGTILGNIQLILKEKLM